MLNNKQTEGLLFNSDDKKTKYFQKPFFLGTGLNETRRHFNVKFVFKYDRNTVVNILKKQGVPAP